MPSSHSSSHSCFIRTAPPTRTDRTGGMLGTLLLMTLERCAFEILRYARLEVQYR